MADINNAYNYTTSGTHTINSNNDIFVSALQDPAHQFAAPTINVTVNGSGNDIFWADGGLATVSYTAGTGHNLFYLLDPVTVTGGSGGNIYSVELGAVPLGEAPKAPTWTITNFHPGVDKIYFDLYNLGPGGPGIDQIVTNTLSDGREAVYIESAAPAGTTPYSMFGEFIIGNHVPISQSDIVFGTPPTAPSQPAIINGTNSNDSITLNTAASGNNHDAIYGMQGNDTINMSGGNSGNNAVYGGKGDDSITVDGGFVNGNIGNDTIITNYQAGNSGTVGNSTLHGGQGNDYLYVSTKNVDAFLYGDKGNDTLSNDVFSTYALAGPPYIWINPGASAATDVHFMFGSGTGNDVIQGFVPGNQLVISSDLMPSVSQVLAHTSVPSSSVNTLSNGVTLDPGDSVISLPNGGSITVVGDTHLTAADISVVSPHDYLFPTG